MPTYKISQLTTATAVSATNQFEINQNGASKSVEVSVLDTYIKQTSNLPVVVSVSAAVTALKVVQTGSGKALDVKGGMRLSGATAGYVGIEVSVSAGSTTYTLPSADGTSGQVLSTNGSGALSWTTASTIKAADTQTFNSSGTWTKPSGYGSTARAYIQAWGAGGGGGRYNANNSPGGGGGGGAYAERWIALSSLGATETITIGAGGTAPAGNGAGGVGGTTSVGSILSAYGGGGGGFSSTGAGYGGGGGGQIAAGSTGSGVATPAAPGSPWATPMSSGGDGSNLAGAGFWGGGGGGYGANGYSDPGGASYLGGGGGGGGSNTSGGAGGLGIAGGGNGGAGTTSGTATAGAQPGGGGGGAYTGTAAAGGAGRVIITVFDGV